MQIYRYPTQDQWPSLVERPHLDVSKLNDTVSAVLEDVRKRGDEAVKDYELKFDHAALSTIAVSPQEIDES